MDSEISGTVLSASPRITGNGKTIYDITFSDGNTYCTFDAKIWAKVQAVAQQPATARVSVQQKGDFTNFYLNDIAPQGQLAATSAPVATQAAPPLIRAPQAGGMSPEREQKIVKQSSFATAFNFVASLFQGAGETELETATNLAHDLARELYGHVMGTTGTDEPVAVTPEPVAAAAATNGTSDGIPW